MAAPKQIFELVARFDRNRDAYRSGQFNEPQLRRSPWSAKLPNEKDAIQRQIAATDGQIDGLVYELYGLTEDEIGIVEEKEDAT
jgi:hypothetical protein